MGKGIGVATVADLVAVELGSAEDDAYFVKID